MSPRARGFNVRKVCDCGWRRWPKCSHAWYFSFKPRGRMRYRFSLDAELGKHFESKTDAENAATNIRVKILDGTFRRAAEQMAAPQTPAPEPTITLGQFVSVYVERVPQASGKVSWRDDKYLLATLCNHAARDGRTLGDWPLTAITEDELEVFHTAQRAAGRAGSTLNHRVQVIKAAFRWAVRKGYLTRLPISDESTLKRIKATQRTRRLMPDEETKLLAAAAQLKRGAGIRLSGLIVAAIETGCRRGELLSLRWVDVNLTDHELTIRAENAKDREVRVIPISTRLAAVLEMMKTDPAARPYPPTACVFGHAGRRIANIKKAWESAVLLAHRHEPEYLERGALSPASRARLTVINLHFHDLRHEAGSRWLEAGMPLHHVKELLGHANISQTDTYLNAGRVALRESMKRVEEALRGKSVANPWQRRPR